MIVDPYRMPGHLPLLVATFGGRVLARRLPSLYEKTYLPAMNKLLDIRLRGLTNSRLSSMLGSGEMPIFATIEIETINRCNGECDFCPVNREAERRPFRLMDSGLFASIISQLGELDYQGSVGMYLNNEPLLDGRVYGFCEYARSKLPKAYIYMLTNGTLLDVERLKSLMGSLDALIIDNYDDRQKISGPLADVVRFAEGDVGLRERVVTYLRKGSEYRTTRGGNSPNRHNVIPLSSPCCMPFSMMAVRPDGKLSLCCCDVYESVTLGDLTEQGILEAWRGERYNEVRRMMLKGRQNIGYCRRCDVLNTHLVGKRPFPLAKPKPASLVGLHGGYLVGWARG